MFANKYLEKQKRNVLIRHSPDENLGIIVVIPCFREPDILSTLVSFLACKLPKASTEVIILINHAETAPADVKTFNQNTKVEIENWISLQKPSKINYFVAGPVTLKQKWAGAGLARKSGMDEALRRFNLLEKPNGIIVSLDADTLVDENYLTAIENHFCKYPKHVGLTLAFEHQKQGLEEKHREGICLYEKYLAYYREALAFTGFPYALFTIGSAFAVTASAYVKRGGMNRRQAGEDFYFLQGLVQLGDVGYTAKTKVYPSARLSNRVPFGTGPVLQKWMNNEEDLTKTFNFKCFLDLKEFFDIRKELFKTDNTHYLKILSKLPESISWFLEKENFLLEIEDLNKNCSVFSTFEKRFFQKFNAFKVLKYLNFTHEYFYEKENLIGQINLLNKKQWH